LRVWTGVFYTGNGLGAVNTGNEKRTGGFLKEKKVCESRNSYWLVGDQILVSCNKMQKNYFKIIQCDFLDFSFRFSHTVEDLKNYRLLHAL